MPAKQSFLVLVIVGLFLSVYLRPMKSQDVGKWEKMLSGSGGDDVDIVRWR